MRLGAPRKVSPAQIRALAEEFAFDPPGQHVDVQLAVHDFGDGGTVLVAQRGDKAVALHPNGTVHHGYVEHPEAA